MSKFRIVSPDGFPFTMEDETYTKEQVPAALEAFAERYRKQGYYSSPRYGSIPFDDIADFCTVIPVQEDVTPVYDISFVETLVEICRAVYGDPSNQAMLLEMMDTTDSGVARDYMIRWAKEFETTHSDNDWHTMDWYETIEAFVESKLPKI